MMQIPTTVTSSLRAYNTAYFMNNEHIAARQ